MPVQAVHCSDMELLLSLLKQTNCWTCTVLDTLHASFKLCSSDLSSALFTFYQYQLNSLLSFLKLHVPCQHLALTVAIVVVVQPLGYYLSSLSHFPPSLISPTRLPF